MGVGKQARLSHVQCRDIVAIAGRHCRAKESYQRVVERPVHGVAVHKQSAVGIHADHAYYVRLFGRAGGQLVAHPSACKRQPNGVGASRAVSGVNLAHAAALVHDKHGVRRPDAAACTQGGVRARILSCSGSADIHQRRVKATARQRPGGDLLPRRCVRDKDDVCERVLPARRPEYPAHASRLLHAVLDSRLQVALVDLTLSAPLPAVSRGEDGDEAGAILRHRSGAPLTSQPRRRAQHHPAARPQHSRARTARRPEA